MSSAASLSDILAQKRLGVTDESHRYNSYRSNGLIETIDKTPVLVKDSLPEWLRPVVQNEMWAKRYQKLETEAPIELRALVSYALKNARDVFRYMNKACSKANWDETVKKWRKSLNVARIAPEIIKRIGARKSQYKAVYKAVWRFGEGVLRHAVTAEELGRDRVKLFCWLVWKSNQAMRT